MLKKLALIILCISLVIAAGCNAEKQNGPDASKDPKANTIMDEFQTLAQKDFSIEEVASFISNNISDVSKEDASKMVDEFEKIQKKNLPQFENMFFQDDMQNKIYREYKSITEQTEIKDSELKDLLAKTKNSGYKVETAEGTFFPIIDYAFYKDFSSYVTLDMKDYIDIMVEESNIVPAKDAALVIGWDEVIKRALNQEKFLGAHMDSVKLNDIKQLYQKYITFTLYGANNTPLFSYDAKTLDSEVREIYENAVGNTGGSDFLKALNGFVDVVKNNDYKLTNEVEKYRDNVINNLEKKTIQ